MDSFITSGGNAPCAAKSPYLNPSDASNRRGTSGPLDLLGHGYCLRLRRACLQEVTCAFGLPFEMLLLFRIKVGTILTMITPVLQARFYKTPSDSEPVRDWLKTLSAMDRKIIGEDLKTVQLGWPLGMPLVRKLDKDLWEVRIRLEGRIARVLFTASDGVMILLHGFIKKSEKTPKDDLALAKRRIGDLRSQS